MAPPWSRPLEVDRLADGGADVDFAVPLAELSGLRRTRPGLGGNVEGHAHFARERGFAVAQIAMKGVARLECQRCMQPMEIALDSQVRVALVAEEADIERVPEDLEPVLTPGGRISIGELIAEELLLSLPIVALHEEGRSCTAAPPGTGDAPQAPETQRPFAHLDELLKRRTD
jgi:uncharacterized protein